MSWPYKYLLEYSDPRYFVCDQRGPVDNLFIDWLNENFGLRKHNGRDRWNMFSTEAGQPWGVRVAIRDSKDAMLFKLTWL